MTSNKNSFVFYETFESVIEELPEEMQLKFYKYITQYGLHGIEPEVTGIEKAIWTQIQFAIDQAQNRRKRAIENGNKSYKEKVFNRIKSKLKLNPQTNRYDYDRDLDKDVLLNFISEDKEGFIINFGKIVGNFICDALGLTSLKGAPTEVSGHFICSNNKLTSLEGAPQTVGGSFDCGGNRLSSLKGAPQEVGGSFYCDDNHLTSLKGAPQIVGESFNCSWNSLTSLKGAPQLVGWGFDCRSNPNLNSLEGIGKVKGKIYKNF